MEYLIFSEILAKRLLPFSSYETNNCATGIFESPQEIRWSYLKTIFDKLDYCYYKEKDPKQAPFAPPPDLRILDHLLPKVQSSTEDLRLLQPACPLANAILNLANKQLVDMLQLFQNDSGLKLNSVNIRGTHFYDQMKKKLQNNTYAGFYLLCISLLYFIMILLIVAQWVITVHR